MADGRAALWCITIGLVAAVVLGGVSPRPAGAQAQGCLETSTLTADLCEKSADLFRYMMPQLGAALVGGSHTLGLVSTPGRFPHAVLALRLNALAGDLPVIRSIAISPGGRSSTAIGTESALLGLPGIDVEVGLVRGFRLGTAQVGGVSASANATFVPEIRDDEAGVRVAPTENGLRFGFGVRVGLVEQSHRWPGFSISWARRDLARLDVVATSGDDELMLRGLDVRTASWRVSAQRNVRFLQFNAGAGEDRYRGTSLLTGIIRHPFISGGSATFESRQEVTFNRNSAHLSVGVDAGFAKIVGEVGRVQGGKLTTFNTFTERADKPRAYGSVGARLDL